MTHPRQRYRRTIIAVGALLRSRAFSSLAILLGALVIAVSSVPLSATPLQASSTHIEAPSGGRLIVSVEGPRDCESLTLEEEAAGLECVPAGEGSPGGFFEDIFALIRDIFGGADLTQVNVPAISRLPESAALAVLDDAGLAIGARVEAFHTIIPAGFVISQDPRAGVSLASGSMVGYTVSSGPPVITIPTVRDLPAADAYALLQQIGLQILEVELQADRGVAAGDALGTDPPAGAELAEGSGVVLITSTGPELIVVPRVVGLGRREARADLEDVGLFVDETTFIEDQAPDGTVLDQDPPAGMLLAAGSTVDITLSSGPALVVVPNIRGRRAASAVARLSRVGLGVSGIQNRSDEAIPAGDAIRTQPLVGSEVREGSAVVLHVSRGPAPIAVPDVVGRKRKNARAALLSDGLAVDRVTIVDSTMPKNTVVTLDPPAGVEVPAGFAVTLAISAGPPLISVPEVQGRSATDAFTSLEQAGLVISAVRNRSRGNVDSGSATKTDPAAGTEVEVGSAVVLVISRGPEVVPPPDTTTVPVVRHRSAADAVADIMGARLGISEIQHRRNADVAAGDAIRSSPGGNSEVGFGSDVTLFISSGPRVEPGRVTVPDVRSRRAADAFAQLEQAGLVDISIQNQANPSIVAGAAIRSQPAAGRRIRPGAAVTLVVSRGPAPVLAPDIVGLRRNRARAALRAADLRVGGTTFLVSPEPDNTVLTQDPPAGVELAPGSPVHFVISAGPAGSESPPDTASRRQLENVLLQRVSPLLCDRWRQDDAPFDFGAGGAIRCEDPERGVSQLALFTFPDSRSIDRFWDSRMDQLDLGTLARATACRDGRQGVARWNHGTVACYVPDSGRRVAKMRWTDERTDTYGVLDASNRDFAGLYRSWLTHRSP